MNLNLDKFLNNLDCNMCEHLNFTEQEQKDNKRNHECNYFDKRVLHIAITRNHKEQLYPCKECRDSSYINYKKR